jgi:hypothetical protein
MAAADGREHAVQRNKFKQFRDLATRYAIRAAYYYTKPNPPSQQPSFGSDNDRQE